MVDFQSDNHESLTPKLILFLTTLLNQLDSDARLCGDAGSEIIFVYGYKGDLKAVRNQFVTYISFLKKKRTLSSDDRNFLQEKSDRHSEFQHPDQYPEMAKKAMKDGDTDKFFEFLEKSDNRRKQWHDTKQCLCFCNKSTAPI